MELYRYCHAASAEEGAPHVLAVAVWVSAVGFRASAVRGIITSIRFLLRPPFELGVFATPQEVGGWLADQHRIRDSVEIMPEALTRVLVEARQRAEGRAVTNQLSLL